MTKFLFGDDLKAACSQIDTSTKLGRFFSKSPRGRKSSKKLPVPGQKRDALERSAQFRKRTLEEKIPDQGSNVKIVRASDHKGVFCIIK